MSQNPRNSVLRKSKVTHLFLPTQNPINCIPINKEFTETHKCPPYIVLCLVACKKC